MVGPIVLGLEDERLGSEQTHHPLQSQCCTLSHRLTQLTHQFSLCASRVSENDRVPRI